MKYLTDTALCHPIYILDGILTTRNTSEIIYQHLFSAYDV